MDGPFCAPRFDTIWTPISPSRDARTGAMVACPGRRELSDDERLSVRGSVCSVSAPTLADTPVALRELRGRRRVRWMKAPVFELLVGAILMFGLNIAFAVAI